VILKRFTHREAAHIELGPGSFDPVPHHDDAHVGPYGVEMPPHWDFVATVTTVSISVQTECDVVSEQGEVKGCEVIEDGKEEGKTLESQSTGVVRVVEEANSGKK
jgi:hypothetical protein